MSQDIVDFIAERFISTRATEVRKGDFLLGQRKEEFANLPFEGKLTPGFFSEKAIKEGIPKDYAEANPHDAFMRAMLGKPIPQRNDCGYPSRFEFEDNSRIGGWIAPEGDGLCDYPEHCPLYQTNECPLTKEG